MHSVRDMALGALVAVGVTIGYQVVFTQLTPSTVTRQENTAAAAAELATSSVSSAPPPNNAQNQSPAAPYYYDPPTYYEYKLVLDVDPCTFNTLGKAGWETAEFGRDAETDDEIHNGTGRDATCTKSGISHNFIWVLFKRIATSTNY